MEMKREKLPIRYPEDGKRMLDVVMKMTLQDADFAMRVQGARMRAVERYIDKDESGRIIKEGYVIEAVFSDEQQATQRHGWSVAREELLIPA